MKINGTAAKHIKKYCYIVGLLSFLLAFFVCSQMIRYQEKEKKAVGTYMAQSTIRRVKEKLDNYITISDLLGNYIIDGSDMDENTFSELAEKIPNEDGVVKAFELAPEGIITEIYPMQGNSEALGLDLLREHERKKDAVLAKETREYTLGGPYQLKQGGSGALLFKPVYQNDDSGKSSFWGFVLQVIDWDCFMSDINLKSLSEADFSYKIWSYDRSSEDKNILAQSQEDMPEDCLTIECEIPNNTWYFDIAPSQITQMPGQCTSSTSIRSWMIRPGIRHRLPHRDTMDWQCAIWQKEIMILLWKISAAEFPLLPMMKCRACYLMKL